MRSSRAAAGARPVSCWPSNARASPCWYGGRPARTAPNGIACAPRRSAGWTWRLREAMHPTCARRPCCTCPWVIRVARSMPPTAISPCRRNWPTCACWRERRPPRRTLRQAPGSSRGFGSPASGIRWPKAFSMLRRAVRVASVVRVLIALLFAAAALGAPRVSFAHATSTSYLHIEAPRADGPVDLLWDLAAQDIMWTIFIDQDFDGVLTWKEVEAARSRYLEPGVLAEISVA